MENNQSATRTAKKVQAKYLAATQLDEQTRVQLVGTIVDTQEFETWKQGVLDDGTGTAEIRLFDKDKKFTVGEQVRIIGRMRTYQGVTYVNADILKKIDDPRWIQHWKLSFELTKKSSASPTETILAAIRELDEGDGADAFEVARKTTLENASELIETLKRQGEVFETKPGKIKVLE